MRLHAAPLAAPPAGPFDYLGRERPSGPEEEWALMRAALADWGAARVVGGEWPRAFTFGEACTWARGAWYLCWQADRPFGDDDPGIFGPRYWTRRLEWEAREDAEEHARIALAWDDCEPDELSSLPPADRALLRRRLVLSAMQAERPPPPRKPGPSAGNSLERSLHLGAMVDHLLHLRSGAPGHRIRRRTRNEVSPPVSVFDAVGTGSGKSYRTVSDAWDNRKRHLCDLGLL